MTTVLTSTNGDVQVMDGIFNGISFFLILRLTCRASYVSKVQSQGGRVVKLEAQADYIIADHMKPEQAPVGSVSYTFIDAAIRDGRLPEREHHRAGPEQNAARAAGSMLQPAKQTRTPFTATDDKLLIEWVESSILRGLTIRGNELYKQLEAQNNRHTWQSWRDRYVKTLSKRAKPLISQVEEGSPRRAQPPTAQPVKAEPPMPQTSAARPVPNGPTQRSPVNRVQIHISPDTYTHAEIDKLVGMGDGIIDIDPDKVDAAWNAFAELEGSHTAKEWRILWDYVAKPIWERLQLEKVTEETRVEANGLANVDAHEAEGVSENLQIPVHTAQQPETERDSVPAKRPREEVQSPAEGRGKRARVDTESESEVGEATVQSRTAQTTSEVAVPNTQVVAAQTSATLQTSAPLLMSEEDPLEETKRRLFGFSSSTETAMPPALADEAPKQPRDTSPHPNSIQSTAGLSAAEADSQERRSVDRGNAQSALTEANLASHRALLQPQSRRAADIPEDDENDDQIDFINFLQDVVNTPVKQAKEKEMEQALQAAAPEEAESVVNEDEQMEPNLLSDQDIDDVIDGNTQWPFDEVSNTTPKKSMKASQLSALAPSEKKGSFELPKETPQDDANAEEMIEQERLHSATNNDGTTARNLEDSNMVDSSSVQPDSIEELEEGDLLDLSLAPPDGGWATMPSDGEIAEPAHDVEDLEEDVPGPITQLEDTDEEVVERSYYEPLPRHSTQWSSDAEEVDDDIDEQMDDSDHDLPQNSTQRNDGIDILKEAVHEVVDVSSHISTSSYDIEDDISITQFQTQQTPRRVFDTQAVLDLETQPQDFDFPPPLSSPGSPTDAEEYNMRKRGEKRRATSSYSGSHRTPDPPGHEEQDLDVYIPNLQSRFGYSEADIVYALECSSMRPQLAEMALAEHAAGRGWPTDVAGFWSKEEDEIVRESDQQRLKSVTDKMGWEEIIARLDWLVKYEHV